MKRHIQLICRKIFLTSIFLLFHASICPAQEFTVAKAIPAPFTRGVNLTGWFETWTKDSCPDLNMYTKQDFQDLKTLGTDVIRLPIHFDMFCDPDNSYAIDDIIFSYLDRACDWAEELEIYLIIDNHSFNQDPYPDCKEATEHLKHVWPQIAKRYRNRSRYIMYEILNEPRLTEKEWIPLQEEIIRLIRKYDRTHTIVVTGNEWGSLDATTSMKPYKDKNLIYTFHYYDPFVFSHQGASWTDQYMAALSDVPFPYDRQRLPEMKGILKDSYIEYTLNNDYKKQSDLSTMKRHLAKATIFSQTYQVPVYAGEMGIYSKASPYEDRVRWYQTVGKLFQELNLPFTVWGYDDQFGFFRKGSARQYPYDLDLDIVAGLGFNIPAETDSSAVPEKSRIQLPFTFFDDFMGPQTSFTFWTTTGKSKVFKDSCPQGNYSLLVSDMSRYEGVNFFFKNLNLEELNSLDDRLMLRFYIKFTDQKQQVTLRFKCYEGEGDDVPWRYEKKITARGKALNIWTEVDIPLTEFKCSGAWYNSTSTWRNPDESSQRDWNRVECFSIVMEDAPLKGEIYFDDIMLYVK